MTKPRILLFAAFMLLAFSALVPTSASAVELTFEAAEWLVSGTVIEATEKLATEYIGELEFHNESNGGILMCKSILDGTVEANGLGAITEALNTAKELITELNGLAILCFGLGTCLETEDAEAWPLNLPWNTTLELDIPDETWWLLFTPKLPTYHVKCLTIIGSIEEECTAPENSGNKIINLATDVEASGLVEALGTCTNGGAGVGDIVTVTGNLTLLTSGSTLQASVPSATELVFELDEWLASGAELAAGEKLAAEYEGELELKNESNGGILMCKSILDGTVEANGLGAITEALNTAKELITELNGLAILCLGLGTCLETEDAEAWPLNLPWNTTLQLDNQDEERWLLFLTRLPSYHVKCLTIIGTIEEECTAAEGSGSTVMNLTTDVETSGLVEPLGTCTNGGAGVGDIVTLTGNLTLLTSGLTLQASVPLFELAEWLASGTVIEATEKLAAEYEGELELKNESNGGILMCKSILDGTVEANGLGAITEALNTAKELITELNGLAILCLGLGTCLETEDAEAWPLNLPWNTTLELDIPDETWWLLFTPKLPTYHVKCLTIIGSIEEECTAAEGSGNKVLNLATDVEASGLVEALGTCTNGAGVGDIVTVTGNLTLLTSGLTLQASE